jgi:hypothetical protein
MPLARVLKTAQVTLEHVFYVDLTATDAAGSVTATARRLDGTLVHTATAAHPGLGRYTYALPAQAQLDALTVDWVGTVGGVVVSVRDFVEIVGGFLFGLQEAAVMPPALDLIKYPAATLAAKRIEVEQQCERICGQAFVPRFARIALSGQGTARLTIPRTTFGGHTMLRTLRSVAVAGVAWSAPDVAAVGLSDTGVLTRPGGALWPAGARNIVIEYEHGLDYPPEEIRTAAMVHLRSRLGMGDTTVPYRAISFSSAEGGTYRLSTPSKERTGIPDVDAVYEGNRGPQRVVFA